MFIFYVCNTADMLARWFLQVMMSFKEDCIILPLGNSTRKVEHSCFYIF